MNQKTLFSLKYICKTLFFFGFDFKKLLSSINPKNRIWINSDFKYLIKLLSELFEIKLFSYVDDIGDFHENVKMIKNNIDLNFNCNFGCGIFILQKRDD